MVHMSIPLLVALCLSLLVLGGLAGWYGFYHYSNHLYRKYPEVFKARLDRKIERWRAKGSGAQEYKGE